MREMFYSSRPSVAESSMCFGYEDEYDDEYEDECEEEDDDEPCQEDRHGVQNRSRQKRVMIFV